MTLPTPPCGGIVRLDLLKRVGAATARVTLVVERCRRACPRQPG
ncbi:hypothetical protein [Embleya sp. NPDC059259]